MNTPLSSRFGYISKFASPLIDILTLFFSIRLSKALVSRFEARDIWNVFLILGAYLLMCGGIWMGKRLKPNPAVPGKTSDKDEGNTTENRCP